MAIPQAEEIESLATKYTKQQLQQMAQMGEIDSRDAVLAGMMIDRIVQANIKPPTTTVAQDVIQPTAMASLPAAQQAVPQPAQMGAPTPAPMASPESAMLAEGGLASLPVPDSLYDDSYAGGGIVAFSNGDLVSGLGSTFDSFMPDDRTPEEKARDYAYELYRRNQDKMRNVFAGNVPLDKNLAEKRIGPEAANLLRIQDMSRGALPAGSAAAPVARPAGVAAAPAASSAASAVPAGFSVEDFRRLQEQFGVPTGDIFAEDRADAAKRREELVSRGKKNEAISMIMAGLSGMNTKNLAEFAEKASTTGFGQYIKGDKEIREEQRELDKINRDLRKADVAFKRGDMEQYTNLQEKAKERELKLEKLALDKEVAAAQKGYYSRPSQFREQYEIYSADEKAAGRKPTFEGFRKSLGSGDETAMLNRQRYADAALSQDTEYLRYSMSKKPEDQQKARDIRARIYRQYGLTSSSGPAGATAGRATFLGFE